MELADVSGTWGEAATQRFWVAQDAFLRLPKTGAPNQSLLRWSVQKQLFQPHRQLPTHWLTWSAVKQSWWVLLRTICMEQRRKRVYIAPFVATAMKHLPQGAHAPPFWDFGEAVLTWIEAQCVGPNPFLPGRLKKYRTWADFYESIRITRHRCDVSALAMDYLLAAEEHFGTLEEPLQAYLYGQQVELPVYTGSYYAGSREIRNPIVRGVYGAFPGDETLLNLQYRKDWLAVFHHALLVQDLRRVCALPPSFVHAALRFPPEAPAGSND